MMILKLFFNEKKHKTRRFCLAMMLISCLIIFNTIINYYLRSNQRRLNSDTNMYPTSLLTRESIKHYGWILYIIGILYMFMAINIICDRYLVSVMEVIVNKLNMSNDVAGATFLAVGGSSPELFTSFISIYIMDSDIGFGTIVGSAVFNVKYIFMYIYQMESVFIFINIYRY